MRSGKAGFLFSDKKFAGDDSFVLLEKCGLNYMLPKNPLNVG